MIEIGCSVPLAFGVSISSYYNEAYEKATGAHLRPFPHFPYPCLHARLAGQRPFARFLAILTLVYCPRHALHVSIHVHLALATTARFAYANRAGPF